MDLQIVKYHVQALYNILIQEPINAMFARLCVELGTMLNSSPLKNIEPKSFDENIGIPYS